MINTNTTCLRVVDETCFHGRSTPCSPRMDTSCPQRAEPACLIRNRSTNPQSASACLRQVSKMPYLPTSSLKMSGPRRLPEVEMICCSQKNGSPSIRVLQQLQVCLHRISMGCIPSGQMTPPLKIRELCHRTMRISYLPRTSLCRLRIAQDPPLPRMPIVSLLIKTRSRPSIVSTGHL